MENNGGENTAETRQPEARELELLGVKQMLRESEALDAQLCEYANHIESIRNMISESEGST